MTDFNTSELGFFHIKTHMWSRKGNFDNKEFSIAIFICTCKSHTTTFPVCISESESRLTKEGSKPINVYKQCLPRK